MTVEQQIAEAVRAVVREEVEPIRRQLAAALSAASEQQLLSAAEVAAELGVSTRTAQRWLRDSPLAVGRGRVRRISRADLREITGAS